MNEQVHHTTLWRDCELDVLDTTLESELQTLALTDANVRGFLMLKQREGLTWSDTLAKLVVHLVHQNEEMKKMLIDITRNQTVPNIVC